MNLLSLISARYPLSRRPALPMCDFTANGMKLHVTAYDARGLGFVSEMTADAPTGQRVMDTVIVNPFEVDAPLLSFDGMYMGGSEMYLLELYQTGPCAGFSAEGMRALAGALPSEENPGTHWYDDIMRFSWKRTSPVAGAEPSREMVRKLVTGYLDALKGAPACDPAQKRRAAAAYTEALLQNGGPAVNVMRASLDGEAVAALLRDCLFGTGAPA